MTAASGDIDLSRAQWRKSTRSTPEGANCVEIAPLGQAIAVRDSTNPEGPKLIFSDENWRQFADDLKRGKYGL